MLAQSKVPGAMADRARADPNHATSDLGDIPVARREMGHFIVHGGVKVEVNIR